MVDLEYGIAEYEASNFSKAFEVLMPLAQAGELQAQKVIAHMYSFGQDVEVDFAEATKWYRLAAEQGDPVAQNNLASHLLEENPEEAIKWYTASAEQGFPFAEETLGDIYSGNLGISGSEGEKIKNLFEAAKWYEKAANKGFSIACHRLGDIYSSNQTLLDEEKAIEWYQRAAAKDHKPSQKIIGQAYAEGLLGLPKDSEQSRFWLDKAQHGNGEPLL
jgi:uncharacterized protein